LQERTILCDSRFDKAAMLNSCKINAAGRRSAAGVIHISAAIAGSAARPGIKVLVR
jgi:hypothetical protein